LKTKPSKDNAHVQFFFKAWVEASETPRFHVFWEIVAG